MVNQSLLPFPLSVREKAHSIVARSLKLGTKVVEMAPALELDHLASTWVTASLPRILPRILPRSGLTEEPTEPLGELPSNLSRMPLVLACFRKTGGNHKSERCAFVI